MERSLRSSRFSRSSRRTSSYATRRKRTARDQFRARIIRDRERLRMVLLRRGVSRGGGQRWIVIRTYRNSISTSTTLHNERVERRIRFLPLLLPCPSIPPALDSSATVVDQAARRPSPRRRRSCETAGTTPIRRPKQALPLPLLPPKCVISTQSLLSRLRQATALHPPDYIRRIHSIAPLPARRGGRKRSSSRRRERLRELQSILRLLSFPPRRSGG